jgi:hypothetical protein
MLIFRKNEALARALKEKGNKSYGSGDNIQAVLFLGLTPFV